MTEKTISEQSPINRIPPEKRWQPGKSGNPNGRPPNTNSITYWYKTLLAENEGMPAKEIAQTAIKKAKQGSIQHIQEVTDRTDGRLGADFSMLNDNRVINFIVSSEENKELVEGVKDRLLPGKETDTEELIDEDKGRTQITD